MPTNLRTSAVHFRGVVLWTFCAVSVLTTSLALAQKASKEEKSRSSAVRANVTAGRTAIEWVHIPGGTFTMGSGRGGIEGPAHSVTLKSFQLAKTPVTNRQYRACLEAGACTPPDAKCLTPAFSGAQQPVVCVDWNQAKAYCEWAGGRLPSEAEWEYAARSSGKEWKYPWGNEDATCDRAVIGGCASATMPVCSKPKGNSQQGLCDMAGNVWEWVEDWYHDSYKGAPTDGSAWEDVGSLRARVLRGGSFYNPALLARAANRNDDGFPDRRGDGVGFRPARSH